MDGNNNRRNHQYPSHGPIFHGTDDENFRSHHDWNNYIPMTGVWTTERPQPFYPHRSAIHRDNSNGFVKGYNQYNGFRKYCDCSKGYPSNFQQQQHVGQRGFQPDVHHYYDDEMNHPIRRSDHQGVDDKLEDPFKIDRGRK